MPYTMPYTTPQYDPNQVYGRPTVNPFLDTGDLAASNQGFSPGDVFTNAVYGFDPQAHWMEEGKFEKWLKIAAILAMTGGAGYAALAGAGSGAGTAAGASTAAQAAAPATYTAAAAPSTAAATGGLMGTAGIGPGMAGVGGTATTVGGSALTGGATLGTAGTAGSLGTAGAVGGSGVTAGQLAGHAAGNAGKTAAASSALNTYSPYLQMAGAGLQAYQQHVDNQAARELQKQMAAANLALNEPRMQQWRQGQAMMSEILPQIRNYHVTPPSDLARFTPTLSGGARVPEQGFSPSTLSFFTPEARMAAEQNYYKMTTPITQTGTPDLSALGYGGPGVSSRRQATRTALDPRTSGNPRARGGQ